MAWLGALVVNVFYAALILLAALWLSALVKRRIEGLAERHERIDRTLSGFFGELARYAIVAIAVIFVLGRFGIQTTSLVALIGAAALAVGLALQGTLANLAAGVMIILFRPFKAGDYITGGGQSGTVSALTLVYTELTTPDNVQIIVPNGDLWARPIVNYSAHDTRRCDLTVGVSYDTDLARAEEVLRAVIADEPRAFKEPEPFIRVTDLGPSSVDFTLRIWCKASDYWDMRFDLTRRIKEALDEAGIEIPFPTTLQINRAA